MTTAKPEGSLRRESAALLFSVVMLSGVAIYNRYPLVWPDTGGYLAPVNLTFRSIFYSIFIYPSHLTGSLWPVVFVQSLMVTYLLRLVLREVFEIGSRAEFLIVVALLCLLTSLPWYTGFVMPDIFTPLLVLGLFLLAFCFEHLGRGERIYLVGLTFLAAIAHYSNIPIAVGLIVVGLLVFAKRQVRASLAPPNLMMPGAVIAVSVITIVMSNYLTIGMATFSAGGYGFELARLADDGQAVAYLRESCPQKKYRLCEYLDRLPMKNWRFLWAADGPLQKIGWMKERNEGLEVISNTIKSYPLWTLQSAIKNTFGQIERVKTGGGLISYLDAPYPTRDLKIFYPADFAAYQDSRQSLGELASPRMDGLKHMQIGVIVFSSIYSCLIAVILIKAKDWLPVELMMTVAAALLFNGFISGALSQPDDRYGSRIIWLVPLLAIASWRKMLGLR